VSYGRVRRERLNALFVVESGPLPLASRESPGKNSGTLV
jgi:hypothetical protein